MRFIKDGPDIPEQLVQAQEDGTVVFFCGAGVSGPAGLPGFAGLVDSLYAELGERPDAVEETARKECRFDTVIYLLERRLGNSSLLREKLWKILSDIDLTKPKATQTQFSLLTLAKAPSGQTRLVTTNFDRLFKTVAPSLPEHRAPYVPVPKQTQWDGLVYLHGLLPDPVDQRP